MNSRLLALVHALLIGCVALVASTPAFAQDEEERDPERAGELYGEGAAAYGEERYEDAGNLFAEAFSLDPNATLAFNAARAYEQAELWEQATEFYGLAIELGDADVIPLAEEAIERIEAILTQDEVDEPIIEERPEVGTINLMVTTDVGSVPVTARVDGESQRYNVPNIIELEPGPHTIEVRASGYVPQEIEVDVIANRMQDVDVQLFPVEPESSSPLRPIGLATMGVGVVALGAGVGFYLRTANLHGEFETSGRTDEDLASQGESAQMLSTVLYSVGAAALAGGLIMWIMGDSGGGESQSAEAPLQFRPTLNGFALEW